MMKMLFANIVAAASVLSCGQAGPSSDLQNTVRNSSDMGALPSVIYFSHVQEPLPAGQVMEVQATRNAQDYYWRFDEHTLVAAYVTAGTPLTISYRKSPADLGGRGLLRTFYLYYRIDGGAVQTMEVPWFPVGGTNSRPDIWADIPVPADARQQVEFWVKLETDAGENVWDSQYGRNYFVRVLQPDCKRLTFRAPTAEGIWLPPQQSGGIRAGDTVCLSYELDRIKALGLRAEPHRVTLIEPRVEGVFDVLGKNGELIDRLHWRDTKHDGRFFVSTGATQIVASYLGTSFSGRTRKDDNFGAGFHFTVHSP